MLTLISLISLCPMTLFRMNRNWCVQLDSSMLTTLPRSHHYIIPMGGIPGDTNQVVRFQRSSWVLNHSTLGIDSYAPNPFSTNWPAPDFSSYGQPGYGEDFGFDSGPYSAVYQTPLASFDFQNPREPPSSFVPPTRRTFHSIPRYQGLPPSQLEDPPPDRSAMTHTSTSSSIRPRQGDVDTTSSGGDPLPSYLQVSLTPSRHLSPLPPSSLRKLLILDLNGTLLVRSPRSKVGHAAAPRVRHVYPRPFMPVFRAYLFSPSTMAWLDTMVWSSAQQHNVDDMVDECFGDQRIGLVAVWARDTLGLRPDEFRMSLNPRHFLMTLTISARP